jgi:hypothetical protein
MQPVFSFLKRSCFDIYHLSSCSSCFVACTASWSVSAQLLLLKLDQRHRKRIPSVCNVLVPSNVRRYLHHSLSTIRNIARNPSLIFSTSVTSGFTGSPALALRRSCAFRRLFRSASIGSKSSSASSSEDSASASSSEMRMSARSACETMLVVRLWRVQMKSLPHVTQNHCS